MKIDELRVKVMSQLSMAERCLMFLRRVVNENGRRFGMDDGSMSWVRENFVRMRRVDFEGKVLENKDPKLLEQPKEVGVSGS